MYKLFYEVKIGQMFTYIIWTHGVVAFTKISGNSAEDETGTTREFNANDIVEVL